MPERHPDPRFSWPEDPSLDRFQRWARELRDAYRDPDAARHAEAVDLVATYDPPGTGPVPLSRAQRVTARSFGYAGWSRLREHLAVVARWTSSPEPTPVDGETGVDRLLRLALLSYGHYDRADLDAAAAMLRSDPDLATASVAAMALCGRADDLATALAADPGLADRPGGPHSWVPLLHVCFGRLGLVASDLAGDAVASARVLLDHGASPDAGFLWRGLPSPFTAITGALGGGERGEPPHPDGVALVELLLERGADPHDAQGLYNRMFDADDSHLPPLLAHGLGRPHPSVWHDRLGAAHPSPEEMLGDHLCFAARDGHADRVRLLLTTGVDPLRPSTHPVLGGRTPYALAMRHGHLDVTDLLVTAGGDPGTTSDVDRLVGAALAGAVDRAEALLAHRPELAAEAVRRRPEALAVAAECHGAEAVAALLRLGWGVDATGSQGRTALHEAALRGDVDLCRRLLELGADRTRVDRDFGATPSGWAEHAGHLDLAHELDPDT